MIAWVIFDMDGLLIDSEPFWKEAEQEVFASLWVRLTLPMMRETTWLKNIDTVRYWYQRFPWDLDTQSIESVAIRIVSIVIRLVKERGQGMSWYLSIMQYLRDQGFKIAIHSSSDYDIITAVMEKLQIGAYIDIVHSGQDETYGKPHPGGYITTCQKLGLEPNQCIAFEDSLNWVISVKAAKIKCVAIPEPESYTNQKFSIADMILNSLDEFDEVQLQKLTA